MCNHYHYSWPVILIKFSCLVSASTLYSCILCHIFLSDYDITHTKWALVSVPKIKTTIPYFTPLDLHCIPYITLLDLLRIPYITPTDLYRIPYITPITDIDTLYHVPRPISQTVYHILRPISYTLFHIPRHI